MRAEREVWCRLAGNSWSFVRRVDVGGATVLWPRQIGEMFNETDLIGQFRLAASRIDTPEGWREARLESWFLAYDPALPVMRITIAGTPIGWIMGQPITSDGVILAEDLVVPLSFAEADPDGFERVIHGFAGRFVAVVLWPDTARLFLDASGTKPVVLARQIRNRRLADAIDQWAFCSVTQSPGCRDFYDQRRAKGDLHHQALRVLGNRLVGILHGCLRHGAMYDEHTAWAHRETKAARQDAPLGYLT